MTPNTKVKINFSQVQIYVKDLEKLISDALFTLQPTSAEKVSSLTKKKRQEKCCRDLLVSKEWIPLLIQDLKDIESNITTLGHELEASEATRYEGSNREEEMVEQLERCQEQLREMKSEKVTLEKELGSLRTRAVELESCNRMLQETQHEKSISTERCSLEAKAAKQKNELLEKDNEGLQKRLDQTSQDFESSLIKLREQEEETETAKKRNAQQNSVVAKLTADNLVQIMKLKEQEAQLTACKADVEAMKQEVEQKKTPWFEEIRSSIELRVKKSFETSEQLKQSLETVQAHHETQICELNLQLQGAYQSSDALQQKLEQRTLELQVLQEETNQLRSVSFELRHELEVAVKQQNEQIAELKITSEALTCTKEQCSKLSLQNTALQNDKELFEARILELEKKSEALESEISSIKRALEKQTQANVELMKRKESVEWELVELRSSLAISAIKDTKDVI